MLFHRPARPLSGTTLLPWLSLFLRPHQNSSICQAATAPLHAPVLRPCGTTPLQSFHLFPHQGHSGNDRPPHTAPQAAHTHPLQSYNFEMPLFHFRLCGNFRHPIHNPAHFFLIFLFCLFAQLILPNIVHELLFCCFWPTEPKNEL